MKTFKNIFIALIFIVIIPIAIGLNLNEYPLTLTIIPLFLLGFLVFNIVVRKSLSFKNYFTSPYNKLSSKVWSEKEYDIPKDLLYEKIIEVVKDSDLKLIKTDSNNHEILAFTRISLRSWGENIYISFESKGDKTIMKTCSTSLFQVTSWGKNKNNSELLFRAIEDSLTV
jgi:hypothetical protein